MSQEEHQPAYPYPIADGLAWVCERLEAVRRDLRRGSEKEQQQDPEPLRRLVEAFRDGSDLAAPLQGLHTALLRAGDPTGVWGHVQPGSRGVSLAGNDPDMPFEVVYRCPLGRCAGRSPDNTTIFPLMCALSGRELIQKTLPG